MFNILIVTHGALAEAILSAAATIVGTIPRNAIPVCLPGNETMEEAKERVFQAVNQFDNTQNLIILTDMLGGTASNITMPLLDKGSVEILTGLNLPMLLHILSHCQESENFQKLCEEAKRAGTGAIMRAGDLLS